MILQCSWSQDASIHTNINRMNKHYSRGCQRSHAENLHRITIQNMTRHIKLKFLWFQSSLCSTDKTKMETGNNDTFIRESRPMSSWHITRPLIITYPVIGGMIHSIVCTAIVYCFSIQYPIQWYISGLIIGYYSRVNTEEFYVLVTVVTDLQGSRSDFTYIWVILLILVWDTTPIWKNKEVWYMFIE